MTSEQYSWFNRHTQESRRASLEQQLLERRTNLTTVLESLRAYSTLSTLRSMNPDCSFEKCKITTNFSPEHGFKPIFFFEKGHYYTSGDFTRNDSPIVTSLSFPYHKRIYFIENKSIKTRSIIVGISATIPNPIVNDTSIKISAGNLDKPEELLVLDYSTETIPDLTDHIQDYLLTTTLI